MQPEALIVDLTDCTYMDSAGLGLIMNYYVSAQGKGHKTAACWSQHSG